MSHIVTILFAFLVHCIAKYDVSQVFFCVAYAKYSPSAMANNLATVWRVHKIKKAL